MTDKELKKLRRSELLELMLEQSKEIDRLRAALSEAERKLADRNMEISTCGSLAEAAAKVSGLMKAAQLTADIYLQNVQRSVQAPSEEETEELFESAKAEVKEILNSARADANAVRERSRKEAEEVRARVQEERAELEAQQAALRKRRDELKQWLLENTPEEGADTQ